MICYNRGTGVTSTRPLIHTTGEAVMELTQEYLKECLDYNPETGIFTWLERPEHHFSCKRIQLGRNAKFVGSIAGGINAKGYIVIGLGGKRYLAHRLAWLYMFGDLPKEQLDHINRNPSDNRINNLRAVNNEENHKNKAPQSNNTSGVVGVVWDKSRGKWAAQIKSAGSHYFLGRYTDMFDAICARKSAERKHNFHENHGRVLAC